MIILVLKKNILFLKKKTKKFTFSIYLFIQNQFLSYHQFDTYINENDSLKYKQFRTTQNVFISISNPMQLTCTRWPRLYRGRKSFNGSSPIDNSNPLFANAIFFFLSHFVPIKQRSRYLSERSNHDDVATGEIAEAWNVSTPCESFPSASFVIALNRISKRFCSLFAVYVTWDKIVNAHARRYTGCLKKKNN